jgi:SAM-dependent methyltransferase
MASDRWEDAEAYERFMGRWSRRLAVELVRWLDAPPECDWLEVGCGTGSLTRAILDGARPRRVVACDTAADFVAACREAIPSERLEGVRIAPGELPALDGGFDVVASSLVLNFLPRPVDSLRQMRDACKPGGRVAACVWDYSGGMELLRHFWDAAIASVPDASAHDEARRFPLCTPAALKEAFAAAELADVTVGALTIPTVFSSFEDYWTSFVDGPGPAPSYLSSLPPSARQSVATALRARLPASDDGSISRQARAWAVRGDVRA